MSMTWAYLPPQKDIVDRARKKIVVDYGITVLRSECEIEFVLPPWQERLKYWILRRVRDFVEFGVPVLVWAGGMYLTFFHK